MAKDSDESAEGSNRGRPTVFTSALAAEIFERMANGQTINSICRLEHMPGRTTVKRWRRDDPQGFGKDYDLAHADLVESWADDMIDIADDATNDWMDRQTQNGTIRVVDHEHISRSALRVKTRQWMLSKLHQKYADKVENKMTGTMTVKITC